MRVLRRLFDREKVFQAFSKVLLLAFSALICLWMISGARAASNNLKDIKVNESKSDAETRVELTFQNEIKLEDVKLEYQRNFAQISINNVQIHPARTKSAKKSQLDKVFVYQYQPDTVRARLMFKGDLAKIESSANIKVDGKKISFSFKSDQLASETKSESVVETKSSKSGTELVKNEISDELKVSVSALDREEEKSAQEILARQSSTISKSSSEKKNIKEDEILFQNRKKESQEPIITAESKPASPAKRILAGLFTVFLVMASLAMAFRRFVLKKSASSAQSDSLIETICTQVIGPKRSISVIRVAKQYMVIANSGDNMQLLCQLGAESGIERYISDDSGRFDSILENKLTTSDSTTSNVTTNKATLRDSIRRRMESFKPLSRV